MVEQSETTIRIYPGTETPMKVQRVKKHSAPPKAPSPEDIFLKDLHEEVDLVLWTMKKAPVIEKSRLDHGFYVFAIMRYSEWTCQSEVVYIGTAEGGSRQERSIFDLQRRFNGSGVIILVDGLSKTRATNVRRALIRKLHPCENKGQ